MRIRDPYYIERARQLRSAMTDAEIRLWSRLRTRQLDGHKFRRQHVIGPYIADFACLDSLLVIELDGGGHGNDEAEGLDAHRSEYMRRCGFQVLRFWNYEVMYHTDDVMDSIYFALANISPAAWRAHAPSLPSPLRGRTTSCK